MFSGHRFVGILLYMKAVYLPKFRGNRSLSDAALLQ